MSALQIELPPEMRAEVSRRAGGDATTEAAWIADAVRQRLTACADLEYLESRAARGSREAFERVLAKVPATVPMPGDEL
ncbi:MAG TPA: hypothetical protein VHR66_31395 [Gemmataceae bacterium]|jgi:hypothetical protein|nr:hypothetical protein [Gemmataceae bacterium]